MKVAFLTNRTAHVNLPILSRLSHLDGVDVAHVLLYDTVAEVSRSLRRTLVELGMQQSLLKLAKSFDYSLRMLGAKNARVRRMLSSKYCHEFAVASGIPCSVVGNLNCAKGRQLLSGMQVDLLITCVCKNILRKSVLDIPRLASINIHPSLLPAYRGPTPTFWALYNGESSVGVTVHKMTERIDEGEIIDQFAMPLDLSMSELEVDRLLFAEAADRMPHVFQVLTGQANSTPCFQSRSPTYFTYPNPRQRRELSKRCRAFRKASTL
ncbi:MAG: hypothetical protein KDB22_27480 [Planctomycetales bacterium]|nr:hypothetical protein [Planctomycetales bacterium]